jgi:hypothetical protein
MLHELFIGPSERLFRYEYGKMNALLECMLTTETIKRLSLLRNDGSSGMVVFQG